ncbi:hypothetical protein VCSRO186_1105 [Vibrio cholerae]|uniref:hypothetical protein n=1 Tax=Vibrio cholerae TaxID=666 RepID=UPI000E67D9E6|nr:hypothetical protein [Vibrio cholerae]EGR0502483.1 hypothetical protein [Vibrio cholerae]EGR1062180.1 hypothetical protein [Vibrio cholerae]EGR1109193.1 hypothetical protein [Vibrio cholerae]EGR2017793.1 hypothetical protein [Vibrio cholerae]EGR2446096.1 hypothetical protein [Vibrio cholerae]
MQNRFKVLLGVILLFPMFAFAKINMAEVNAYAYEGLADMCANSRHITGEQQKELQAIYLQTKHARQKILPANNDFAHYAAKQLWDIHTVPDYEECIALLKK